MRAIATLLAALIVATAAAADYYEGKPECPPDEFCTTAFDPDRPVASDDGDGSIPAECMEDEVPCHRTTDAVPEPGIESDSADQGSKDAAALGLLAALCGLVLATVYVRRR